MQLVCNLLDEGNAAFREGEWTLSRSHFSEGLSVARYAQAEGLEVPTALLESLYVNRAAALHNMVSSLTPVKITVSCLAVVAGLGSGAVKAPTELENREMPLNRWQDMRKWDYFQIRFMTFRLPSSKAPKL